MIKYIGLLFTALGFLMLAWAIFSARKTGLNETRKELDLILASGYVTTHVATEKGRTILDTAPVKVPPRKRTLSKEAAEILKKVEDERQAEKEGAGIKKTGSRKKEEPKQKKAGTDILPAASGKRKDTDVLETPAGNNGKRKGRADVLPEPDRRDTVSQEMKRKNATDVLPESEKKKSTTDILPSAQKKGRGTNILTPKKAGTDVLPETLPNRNGGRKLKSKVVRFKEAGSSGKKTDILPKPRPRKGTDILPEALAPKTEGSKTAVLIPKTDILKQRKEN